MKIEVISRDSMKRFFDRLHQVYNNENEIAKAIDDCRFISINSYSGCPYINELTGMGCKLTEQDLEPSPIPEEYHNQALILHFDDACPSEVKASGIKWKLFSEDQAKSIKVFAQQAFNDKKRLIIHCTAGISRSGAVGSTLNDYFNKFLEDNESDFEWFWTCGCERQISPNPYVAKVLRKILNINKEINDNA